MAGWIKLASFVSLAAVFLTSCSETDAPDEAERPVRGLITTVVGSVEKGTLRRYPGVLEPGEIVTLSFKVPGRLERLDLDVGQRVKQGDVIATLDPSQYELAIENRSASVSEAEALLSQDKDDLARQEELLAKGAATRLSVDNARTDFRASTARLTQARKALASAEEDLVDTKLTVPFDGVINSVDVESFETVASGTTITSLYDSSAYEVSFSVNFEVIEQLQLGTPATIFLADDPSIGLKAVVSELGERADTVSSFPVTVQLKEQNSLIRAGIAVEVAFEFDLPTGEGFLIPLTAAIMDNPLPPEASSNRQPVPLDMYVYDEETGTVKRRTILMAGIRDNKFLVINGLEAGERVAIAGVSFLREGMKVNPLDESGF